MRVKFKPNELAVIRQGWNALEAYCDLYIGGLGELHDSFKQERRDLGDGYEMWFARCKVKESYSYGANNWGDPIHELRNVRLGLVRATLLGVKHAFSTYDGYSRTLDDIAAAVQMKEQAFARAIGAV